MRHSGSWALAGGLLSVRAPFLWLAAVVIVGWCQPARAQWITQTNALRPGWNAVFLHVDASHATLDQLVGKADLVSAEAKTDYRKRIEDLRASHRAAQAKLDELRTAGIHNWKTLKAGVESAWTTLEAAFKKLTN